jgi:PKD repeat protein
VSINANPTPSISGSTIVCSGSSATYTTTTNTGHAYFWVITGGAITSGQGSASINVVWGASGLGTLAVTDTLKAAGCFATTPTYFVNKISGSNPIITGSASVCANSTANYSTPFNTGRSYTWNVVGGTIVSGQGTATVDVLWGTVGSGFLTVTDSIDGLGCKSTTAPYNISIIVSPTGIVAGPTELCANTNAMYGTVNSANVTFTWTVTGGTITSGQGNSSIMVNWGSGPTGLVSLTGGLIGSSCTFEAFRAVKINPIPSAAFTAIQSAGKLTLVPTQTGLAYKWFFGDGDSSSSSYPTHTYAVNGNYTINLKVQSPEGCLNESTQDVNVTSVGVYEMFASLYQMKAYPNPFQNKTTISFNLFEPTQVEMEVFDLTGRLIETMVPMQELKQGKFEFEFNSEVYSTASAVYLVKVKIGDQSQFIRIVKAN